MRLASNATGGPCKRRRPQNVNTRSPTWRFIFTLFSALAQMQREQIAERTSAAMLRHQPKGRRMTRADRYVNGWQPDRADPDRLAEDADEQATIRRIREERRDGRGVREIARMPTGRHIFRRRSRQMM